MQMLAHGVTTGALFILVGMLQERLHTRDMRRMGGLWANLPRFGAIGLFFAVASLGLPGLGNFVGEFLVLLGTYQVSIPMTVLASLGFVVATIYSLALVQQTFHGQAREQWHVQDLSSRSVALLGAMMVVQVWLGLYPQPVLETAGQALHNLYGIGDGTATVSRR